MKERKNKVTAMAMATTIAVTTMAPVQTTTVYAQELDKPPIEAKVNEENKEQEVTKVEALKSENKGAVESNKETNIVEDEKKEESINNKEKEESTSNKENNEDKVKEEEKENTEEKDKEDNQDNKENLDENTKVEDQEKKEEAEIKEGNEGNEALGNTENKSESEKVDDKTLESVEEVENKDLSKVEENKESGEKEKAGGVVFDSKNFPDEEFRKYLKNEHGFTEGQALSEDEINAVKFINVWNMTISDLKGIEYFRNLEYLDCDSTRITSLDVSKNTALEYLDCRDTGITSLDVSQNTDLEYLNCNGTPITSLDVSQNTALEELYCRDTGITSLDVSKNTALLGLYCSDTGITSLDVSNNTALEELDCSDTGITSLDVSNNTALEYLNCNGTPITSLDVSNNTALEYLYCSDTGIISLDVSQNTALVELNCMSTQLTSLDVSNNTALEYLNCNGTPITSLDVSNNTALLGLYCIDTGITNLDVSNNAALEYLICNDTGITNLDVSKNTALLVLACQGAPLTGLNLGNNNNLDLYIDSLNKEVTLTVTSQSFNTIDKLGCKGSEISELKGAQLDKDNNIMTIESMANKITYKYNCGTAKGNPVYLNVTLNLEKGSSTIEVNELDRAYTGNPVNLIKDQDYTITGSEGNVTLTYYKRNSNGGFDKINEATEVGDYKVKIDLNGTDYCNGTQVEKEFKIEKATNTWKDELSIKGWTYGETPKKPTASAQFGNVEFSYSSSENGEFSSTVPTTGGTWYVKAEVVGNDNYTGISDVKEFTIKKAIPNYSIPQDIKATYGQTLKDIKLPEGFSWVDDTQSVGNVGANKFMATYTPSDTNNYEVVNDIEVTVDVTQAINNWTQELSIEGWTYGEAPKKPTASAQFGEIKFSYSNKKTRNYTEEVPTEAGTWYVKAEVIGNDNYTGISDVKEFTIAKAVAPEVVLPTNLSAVQDSLLSTIELPKGWTWIKSDEKVTVNNKGYKARLTVDDNNYDYSKVEGYNAKGHYVERTLTVSVSQGENAWKVVPSIKGWTYGEKANAPIGSANHGEVIFTYSNSPTGKFEATVPTTAGTWYMKATVLATDEYTGLNEIVEFKIEKAINKWTQELSIEGWTYGEAPNNPTALAKFGDVEFTYSNSKDGEFSSTTPTEAGIWYVKAEVIGNDNYTGISDIKEFEIKKAVAPEVILPNNLSAVQDDLLSTIELPKGWIWVNSNEKVTVNNKGYKARLTVDDKNYDYSKVEGYNKDGHYIERTLTVSVSQGKNEWKVTPSIKGWTYGEKANDPVASAEHGSVIFTYSNSPTGKFESTVPSNAGTWYMKAIVLATDEYTGLNEIVEFKIEKATPKYEVPNNLTATLGQTLKDIKLPEGFAWVDATQSLGKVGINKFMATYTPKDTLNYNVVENIEITVTVSNLATPEVIEPSNLSAVQNDLLSTVELPEGWTWVNPNEKVTVNNNGYKARLKVDDEKYDYTNVEGYNKDGHYVERTLTVSVSANRNEWSVIPSIKGWTYGEKENAPLGTAKHGEVIFTYSNSPTGKFESAVPSNAGTWYMKATVLATDEYTGLNEIVEFTIAPKSSEDIKIPEINEDINIDDLVITVGDKTLVKGTDYDITEKQEGNTVTVTITFKGNYTGTITKTYEVEDSGNNKPPIDDDNNNDNNNGDDNNNDNDDNNGDDNNDNDNNGNNNNGDDNNGNDNDDSNNNSGNGGSNNNNNGNNNSSNGNNNSGSTGKDEVIVKPTLPQTGEKNTLGLWGLVLTITGGAIAFITGKSSKIIKKEK